MRTGNWNRILIGCAVLLVAPLSWADATDQDALSSSATNRLRQLIGQVPGEFPHFTFVNHPEQAGWLTHYLWHHFHQRLGNSPTLFNKEYVLTSDIWLGNASPRGSRDSIQEVHRRNLLAVHVDDEGYVSSHQHFAFYDLWARLQVFGPDNAWQRFLDILAWEKEAQAEGGYREYYQFTKTDFDRRP